MKKSDVCVIGGGPSGATIALKLAQFGYSVVLIEKDHQPRSSIGLSLTPGIHHWLELLGITEKINHADFSRAFTTHILWENDQPLIKEFVAHKAGYHVDRAVFDEMLLQSAIVAGVKVLRPCNLHQLTQTEIGEWEITLTHPQANKATLLAKFLVEATGRKSIVKGTKKAYLPKTIAIYAYWQQTKTTDSISFIEAGKDQWYWGAPVVQQGFMACIFSDPCAIKTASSVKAYYLENLKNATLFNQNLFNNKLSDITACSATPYVDNQPIAENYIKVGDAAFSMDPLSSQGVQKAIKSAFQGAIVVNTLLAKKENCDSAMAFYSNMITTEVIKNTEWTKQFYNRQNRYNESQFWEIRKDQSIKPYEEIKEDKISINKWDILTINPKAVIKTIPIVGAYIIETVDAIILEEHQEPFAFVRGIPIVELIKKMHNEQLMECVMVIKLYIPESNPMDVLKWLLYNKIMCKF